MSAIANVSAGVPAQSGLQRRLSQIPAATARPKARRAGANLASEEAACEAACKCYVALTELLEGSSMQARGVSTAQQMGAEQLRGMEQLREMCHIERLQSDYDQMQERGKFHCGIQDAAISSGIDKLPLESLGEVEMQKKDLVAPPCEDVEELHTARIRKVPIVTQQLEELWKQNPGDAAVRRIPQKHEVVFDFEHCRITMPRSFGDGLHEGERALVAGQVLEVEQDLSADGRAGFVMLTTNVPRRAVLPGELDGSPRNQRSRKSMTVEEMDARLEEQARGSVSCRSDAAPPSSARPSAISTSEDSEYGVLNKDGATCLHMHQLRKPPSAKLWMEWREIQQRKRMEEMMARNDIRRRGSMSDQAGEKAVSIKEGVEIDEMEEDMPQRNDLDAMVKALSEATSMCSVGAMSARSARSARSATPSLMGPVSSEHWRSPRPGKPDGTPSSGRSGRRRHVDLTSMNVDLPWDARPPPAPEVVEALVGKFMPAVSAESLRKEEEEQHDPRKPSAWTLHAEAGDIKLLELKFVTEGQTLPGTGEAAAPAQHGAEDDEFWREVFEPAPTRRGLQCWEEACGWW